MLDPVLVHRVWCKGRLAKGIECLIGVESLPILYGKGRLAELFVLEAHMMTHDGVAGTLAAVQGKVWINKGRYLASL